MKHFRNWSFPLLARAVALGLLSILLILTMTSSSQSQGGPAAPALRSALPLTSVSEDAHLCVGFTSGGRPELLKRTLDGALAALTSARIPFRLVGLVNDAEESVLQLLSHYPVNKLVTVSNGNLGPVSSWNLQVFQLCHEPFILQLEDDWIPLGDNPERTGRALLAAMDVLGTDKEVAMVNFRLSAPLREWTSFQRTASQYMHTAAGTRYKHYGVTQDDGWGIVPYGGTVGRRAAMMRVGLMHIFMDPDRAENEFSRRAGKLYKAAFVEVDQHVSEEAAALVSEESKEFAHKAFLHIGTSGRSPGWVSTEKDFPAWSSIDGPVQMSANQFLARTGLEKVEASAPYCLDSNYREHGLEAT